MQGYKVQFDLTREWTAETVSAEMDRLQRLTPDAVAYVVDYIGEDWLMVEEVLPSSAFSCARNAEVFGAAAWSLLCEAVLTATSAQ